MKTGIFAAILVTLAASNPLFAFADDAPAATAASQNQDGTSKTTLNCQWAPGNEANGGNWGCADKDHAKHN